MATTTSFHHLKSSSGPMLKVHFYVIIRFVTKYMSLNIQTKSTKLF